MPCSPQQPDVMDGSSGLGAPRPTNNKKLVTYPSPAEVPAFQTHENNKWVVIEHAEPGYDQGRPMILPPLTVLAFTRKYPPYFYFGSRSLYRRGRDRAGSRLRWRALGLGRFGGNTGLAGMQLGPTATSTPT